MSPQEKVLWAIRFTELKLTELGAGEWITLREDILRFLGMSPVSYEEWSSAMGWQRINPSEQMNLPAVEEAQRAAREILAGQADFTMTALKHPGINRDLIVEVPVSTVRRVVFNLRPDGSTLQIKAGLKDMFIFALGSALMQIDCLDIRRCPACAQVFFAGHGKQEFCCGQCKGRIASRRYRQKKQEALTRKTRRPRHTAAQSASGS